MAEELENVGADTQSPASRGGLGGVLIVLAIALVSAGGGFATPYLIKMVAGSDEPAAIAKRGTMDLPKPKGESVYIPFDEIVVNLDEGRLNRYLRLRINLQVDKAQVEGINKLVDQRKPVLKNWLLSYLSDKGMDDIRGRVGQNRLRREIQDHFNTVLFTDGYDRIHDVLFDEFNVQ